MSVFRICKSPIVLTALAVLVTTGTVLADREGRGNHGGGGGGVVAAANAHHPARLVAAVADGGGGKRQVAPFL